MNQEFCKILRNELIRSKYMVKNEAVQAHFQQLIRGSFYVSGQLAKDKLDDQDQILLPQTTSHLKGASENILATVDDQLSDTLRYLLARLMKDTADQLGELLDKYHVDTRGVRRELAVIRDSAQVLLRRFLPDDEHM